MINLIDYTFFTAANELLIANRAQPAVLDKLNGFIARLQVKYLKCMLGLKLYGILDAAVQAGGDIEPRLLALLDGALFAGDTKEWVGFKKPGTPLADYVYFNMMRQDATFTVGVGELAPHAENGERQSTIVKEVYVFNRMVHQNLTFLEFMRANIADYPEYVLPIRYSFRGRFWHTHMGCPRNECTDLYQTINVLNI